MAWLALLVPFQLVVALTALRYRHAVDAHVWPWLPPQVWWAAAAAAAGITLVLLWRRGRGFADWRPLAELLGLFGGGAILLWAVLPSDHPRPLHWGAIGALLGLAIGLVQRGGRRSLGPMVGPHFRAALARVAGPTLVVLAGAVVVATAQGREVQPGNLALSLVGYPIYALAQLTLFLGLVLPRLRSCGASPWATVAIASGLFALAHWPNPLLLVSCAVAMAFWVRVQGRTPSLAALALSMGLAATAWTQLLPDAWTRHARVGPGYVFHEHLQAEYREQVRAVEQFSRLEPPPEAGDPRGALVDAMFRRILGRAPRPDEARRWIQQAGIIRRETVVRDMHASEEFRQRFGDLPPGDPPTGEPRPLDEALPPTIPGDLEGRVRYFSAVAWKQQQGGTFQAFLEGAYRDILGREASDAERNVWSPRLDRYERGRVLRRFFVSGDYAGSEVGRTQGSRHLGPLLNRPGPSRLP